MKKKSWKTNRNLKRSSNSGFRKNLKRFNNKNVEYCTKQDQEFHQVSVF